MRIQKRKEKIGKMKKNLLKHVFCISFVSLFFMITSGVRSQVKAVDITYKAKYESPNGKYYFIYSILDNENGTYNDVEDIEIYNGVKSSQGVSLDKFKYLATEAKPQTPNENSVNNVNTTNKDNTMATNPLPNAGSSMVAIVILIITIICFIMLYVKNEEYKGIK